MNEDKLTGILVEQLRHGGIRKLTRANKQAEFTRELGDNSFRTDIFITLSKDGVAGTQKYDRKDVHFIAIEVKIKDWKQGLYQAWKYNAFAEKSYLALYKKYAKNLDIELFRTCNVGLIIFDETSVSVMNVPKKNKFADDTYSSGLKETLWSKLAV
ncbi:MAG: hypothetical protein Q8S19_08855, partial [Bacillota bacterium]|nr:hypothetical protein [Bacillota bacterium]